MQLGPKKMEFPLRHYDGNTFSYVPLSENPADLSNVTFTVPDGTAPDGTRTASRVTIGVLDADGLGAFAR